MAMKSPFFFQTIGHLPLPEEAINVTAARPDRAEKVRSTAQDFSLNPTFKVEPVSILEAERACRGWEF